VPAPRGGTYPLFVPSPRSVLVPVLRRSPLRAPGAGLLVAAGAILAAGRAEADLAFTLAGSVLLASLPLLAGCSLLHALLLRRRFRAALAANPGEVRGEEGRPLPTGLRAVPPRIPLVRNGWVSWTRPPGRSRFSSGSHPGGETLLPEDRALVARQEGHVEAEDLFGAFRWRLRLTAPRRVHVLPPRPAVPVDTLLRALASGDLLSHPEGPREGDRVDSRPYAPGDPARLVLWKAWARRRELLVRTPETALDPRDRSLLVCLVAGPGDREAAGVARLLAEELLPTGRARLAADGSPEPVEDLAVALAAISRSAEARHRSGEVLTLAAEAIRKGEAVLVVCPATPPPAPGPLHAAAGSAGELAVLAVGRSAPAGTSRGPLARWLVREDPPGPTREEMLEGLAPLAHGAVRVALADLATGEVVPLAGDTGRFP